MLSKKSLIRNSFVLLITLFTVNASSAAVQVFGTTKRVSRVGNCILLTENSIITDVLDTTTKKKVSFIKPNAALLSIQKLDDGFVVTRREKEGARSDFFNNSKVLISSQFFIANSMRFYSFTSENNLIATDLKQVFIISKTNVVSYPLPTNISRHFSVVVAENNGLVAFITLAGEFGCSIDTFDLKTKTCRNAYRSQLYWNYRGSKSYRDGLVVYLDLKQIFVPNTGPIKVVETTEKPCDFLECKNGVVSIDDRSVVSFSEDVKPALTLGSTLNKPRVIARMLFCEGDKVFGETSDNEIVEVNLKDHAENIYSQATYQISDLMEAI